MLEQNALSYAKLKLNVDVPDLDENWLDGYESAQHETPEESNPYQVGSAEYQQWNEGWWAGFFNEEKLFDWCDTPVATNVDMIINRIQQAAAAKEIAYTPKLSRTKVIISHIVQATAAVMAFGICYQFADLLA
jgi:hypothetical protein